MVLTELSDREILKLMTLEYHIEEEGHFVSEPIVELFCRNSRGERRRIEVEGFHPFFYITEQDYLDNEHDLFNETMVRRIEAREGITSPDNQLNASLVETEEAPRQTLHERNLVKVYTVLPPHVKKLRESDLFEETWEADVFFTNRFLVESDIYDSFTVPRDEDRVHYDDLEPADDNIDVQPRMVTIDIEVWAGDSFPDTQNPTKPITAVTAHDSYDDEYAVAALMPDSVDQGKNHSWPKLPLDEWTNVFFDEAEMLAWMNEWIVDKDPDLLTGWNSSRNEIGSGFDYPYWINRCEKINEWTYKDLSPTDTTFVTNRGSPVVGGREMFDMLQAYKKTQIHEKRSYSLGYIAEDELGYGKEDVADLDEGWLHEPRQFMKYNIRDVEAVVEIERTKSVLEMYDHIRSITGATYSEIADSNIGILDVLFLRQAGSRGIALPTSTRPDVQHYWGAYVFPPKPGKHTNVVYPDLSSLYPNLFRDMNASPETIVGFEEDLAASKYTESDCHRLFVDTRSEGAKKAADEPERTPLYVLKPEVKESFVRETIQDLIDMKYEYKKDEYADEAYEAVKRIVNSCYGVMGDSVSYGKGFRLFDWRIAEAITLAGRDVIKHTAEQFESRVRSKGYKDAEVIAGDTDSCVLSIASAGSMENTLNVAQETAEWVDGTYDEFMEERYWMDENNMAVEIESYAEAALFMNKKKRYAQWVRWDEGELVDEVEVKGFELVRSDSAQITEEVQREVIERILRRDDAKEAVGEYLKEKWDSVIAGEVDPETVGKPSAINSDLWDYGWSVKAVDNDEVITTVDGERLDKGEYVKFYTPQPHVRGARYANEYVEGENIGQGGKPLSFYLNGVKAGRGLPETFDYDHQKLNAPTDKPYANERGMKELDRQVDAIAVEDVRNLPEGAIIDWEKMAEKTLRDPIEPIVEVMGWSFDDLVTEGQQTGLAQYM